MLSLRGREKVARVLDPVGQALARRGVSPDVVTVIGTAGVSAGALVFYPGGHFFVGTMVITAFVFNDMIDGALARASGKVSRWGAFFDSTLDRIGDAAIFSGLALWFAGDGDHPLMVALCLYCLVSGSLVSYARARAEGLGLRCDVGIAERTERLLLVLVTTGLEGLGVPYVQAIGLWTLAVLSTITLGQRLTVVWQQTHQAQPAGQNPPPPVEGQAQPRQGSAGAGADR